MLRSSPSGPGYDRCPPPSRTRTPTSGSHASSVEAPFVGKPKPKSITLSLPNAIAILSLRPDEHAWESLADALLYLTSELSGPSTSPTICAEISDAVTQHRETLAECILSDRFRLSDTATNFVRVATESLGALVVVERWQVLAALSRLAIKPKKLFHTSAIATLTTIIHAHPTSPGLFTTLLAAFSQTAKSKFSRVAMAKCALACLSKKSFEPQSIETWMLDGVEDAALEVRELVRDAVRSYVSLQAQGEGGFVERLPGRVKKAVLGKGAMTEGATKAVGASDVRRLPQRSSRVPPAINVIPATPAPSQTKPPRTISQSDAAASSTTRDFPYATHSKPPRRAAAPVAQGPAPSSRSRLPGRVAQSSIR